MKLTQDLHIHTNLSLCADRTSTLATYLEQAPLLGIDTIGITNHFWDPAVPHATDWYKKQDFEHISKIKQEIQQTGNIKVLFGAECEYCYPLHKIAISEEIAAQMDLLIVPNSHTHITMPKDFYANYQKHADYMLQAYHDILNDPCSKYVTAMAHPFAAVCCPYNEQILLTYISDEQLKECFQETASKHIAIEINTGIFREMTPYMIRNCEYIRMFEIARDCGCQFTVGSDSHKAKSMLSLPFANYIANILHLTDAQIRRL